MNFAMITAHEVERRLHQIDTLFQEHDKQVAAGKKQPLWASYQAMQQYQQLDRAGRFIQGGQTPSVITYKPPADAVIEQRLHRSFAQRYPAFHNVNDAVIQPLPRLAQHLQDLYP